MNLVKSVSKLFSFFFRAGGFFKVRFTYGKKLNFKKLLFSATSNPHPLNPSEMIVVVGTGIAALSILKNIKQMGHSRILVIARDEAFGGKCVNYGCMPSEYFSAKYYLSPADKIKTGKEIIGKLRSTTEQSFRELGFPIVQGEVSEVKDKKIILSDGRHVDFDRLILATGNRTQSPSHLGETTSLEAFWEIQTQELVIVSDNNISSLSYAFMALDQGIKPTVIFTSKLAMIHLPSFQYFYKLLIRRGAKIIFDAKSIERVGQLLKVDSGEKKMEIHFDKVIFNGMPNLNLPLVDNKIPDVFDVNFTTCSLAYREDVYVVGDSSGLLAASEAEFQARALVDSWQTGKPIDMTQLQQLPFRLHGDPSLAMVGVPWTLLKKEWRMVDFKTLGWSLLHGEEGKLWYLYDSISDKVDGIHICHRNAADLISLAAVLIDLPLSDVHWFSTSVHPSSFEIFKILAEDVAEVRQKPKGPKTLASAGSEAAIFSLPPLSQLHQSTFFQKNFSDEERKLAILDPVPGHYLAVLLGIKSISHGDSKEAIRLMHLADGKYQLSNGKLIEYSFPNSTSVTVRMDGKSVTVNLPSSEKI